jgi:hypothetical protein
VVNVADAYDDARFNREVDKCVHASHDSREARMALAVWAWP